MKKADIQQLKISYFTNIGAGIVAGTMVYLGGLYAYARLTGIQALWTGIKLVIISGFLMISVWLILYYSYRNK